MPRLEVGVGLTGTGAFSQGLDRMQAKARRWKQGMGRALAGAFAVGGITAGIRKTMTDMDRIGKLSSTFGLSAEALQRMGFAAEQTGSSVESVAKGMGNLVKAVDDADKGVKTYLDSFDDLNISIEDMNALDPEEQFLMLADAFAGAEDKGKALAALMRILGTRSGRDLANLMNLGSEGVKKLGAQVEVTSEKSVRNIERMNDQMNRFKRTVIATAGEFIGGFFTKTKQFFLAFETGIAKIFAGLQGFSEAIPKFLSGDFKGGEKSLQFMRELQDQIQADGQKKFDKLESELKGRNKDLSALLRDTDELDAASAGGAGGRLGTAGVAGADATQGQFFDPNRGRGGGFGNAFELRYDNEGRPASVVNPLGQEIAEIDPESGRVSGFNTEAINELRDVGETFEDGLEKLVRPISNIESKLDDMTFNLLAQFDRAQR